MKAIAAALVALLALPGCVSTQMNSLVGKPIEEAQLKYGVPAQVVDLPDGRRGYQFQYGGGTALAPTGCLLSFVAERSPAGVWIIRETRVPSELVC